MYMSGGGLYVGCAFMLTRADLRESFMTAEKLLLQMKKPTKLVSCHSREQHCGC